MQDVFKIVQKLEGLRNIPQFIFIDQIYPPQTAKIREEILEFVEKYPKQKEIDIVLYSPGGSADDAYRIIKMFRHNFTTVNIIVPFWAKSAATLLALGGSTIIMDEFGEFGPLDAQIKRDDEMPDSDPDSALIDEYSIITIENRAEEMYMRMLLNLLKRKDGTEDGNEIDIRVKKTILSEQLLAYIPNLYRPLLEKINPYEIGSKARFLAVGEKYTERILNDFNKENLVNDIDYFTDFLVHDCPDHGYIIDYSIVSKYLKNVKESKELGEDYCKTLTELSILFFRGKVKGTHIGFFDDKLIAKEKKEPESPVTAANQEKVSSNNGELKKKGERVHAEK